MKLLSILFAMLLSFSLSFSQTYFLDSYVETSLHSNGDSSSFKVDFKYKSDQTYNKFEYFNLDSTSWVLEYCSSVEVNEKGYQNAFFTSDAISLNECGPINFKGVFHYYPNNKLHYETSVEWIDSTSIWESFDSIYYSPIVGDSSFKEKYGWDGKQLSLDYREEYKYDENQNVLQRIVDWGYLQETYTFKYSSLNLPIQKSYKQIQNFNSVFADTSYRETIFEYDSYSNVISELITRGKTKESMENYVKILFHYDLNVSIDDIISPKFPGNDFSPINFIHKQQNQLLLVESYSWESENLNWVLDERYNYEYTLITGLNDSPVEGSLVYPNPIKSTLQIDQTIVSSIQEVNIIDTHGNILLKTNSTSSIDMSNFNSGIYFYSITTDEGNFNGKFIKE